MKAKLNVDLEFLKDMLFQHKYFAIKDSNDVTLLYSNEDIYNIPYDNEYTDLHANTLTIYSPLKHGAYKYEFPDIMLTDIDFDCSIPNSSRGTLMCDVYLEFAAQSKLMNGDIIAIINDTIPMPFHAIDELTLHVDPASKEVLIFYE